MTMIVFDGIYAKMNWLIAVSDNDIYPVLRHFITHIITDLLSVCPSVTNLSEI